MNEEYQYQLVKRGDKFYLRRKPFTYENPTLRQQVHRGRFAKVAYDQFDKAKGYRDGLPVVAATVKEKLEGKALPKPVKILELTPLQYLSIIESLEKLRGRGHRITLQEILKRQNLKIKVVMPEEKMVIPPAVKS